MARHNEGYAAYLLGDIPRSLAGMAEAAELLAADAYRAPARLDRARVLLEAGLVREAAEALQAGLADLPGEGHDQIRAEFDLELAGRSASRATWTVPPWPRQVRLRRPIVALGATAWVAKATLVGAARRPRPAASARGRHRRRRGP